MDLLTPARTWAADELASGHHDHPVDRMPALQRAVMFCSVVGPFVGLIVAIVWFWKSGPTGPGIGWLEVGLMLSLYALAGFGVTIGFHRLLTHKAFETSNWMRWSLAILGSAAGQGMAIKWIATHRRHHQQSDREGDPHSPHLHGESFREKLAGFYHAHVGWCFDADKQELARSIPDLLADPVLMAIDRLYFLWVGLGILIPGAIVGLVSHSWQGWISGMVWGGVVRICLLQHVTWSINSVCHVWGKRPFNSADHSANNFPIAILSLGEGWHNNHHAFPTSARHGLRWWQFDASYILILAMKKVGLVWNLRLPTESAMKAKAVGANV